MEVSKCTDASKEQNEIKEEELREDYRRLRAAADVQSEVEPPSWLSLPQQFLKLLGFNRHPPPPPPPASNTFRK